MESRTVGIEDGMFGALFALYLVFVIPDPTKVSAENFVVTIVAAGIIVGLFALGLRLAVAGSSELDSWVKVSGVVAFCTLTLPAVLQVAGPARGWAVYIPLPILMAVWIIIRLWAWPVDGDDGGRDFGVIILVVYLVLVEVATVILFITLNDQINRLIGTSGASLVQGIAILLGTFLIYKARGWLATSRPSDSSRTQSSGGTAIART